MLFYSLANFSRRLTVNNWGAAQCVAISLWPRKHKKVTWGLEVVYIDKQPTAVDFNGRTLYYMPFLVLSSKSGRFWIPDIRVVSNSFAICIRFHYPSQKFFWVIRVIHLKKIFFVSWWIRIRMVCICNFGVKIHNLKNKWFLSIATPSVASHIFFHR